MKRLTLLIAILFSLAVSSFAKVRVDLIGKYYLAEVTSNNVNVRSGAGTNFPIATYTYKSPYGKDVIKVSPLSKGTKIWVKDSGAWWEIEPYDQPVTRSKQFISKKFAKIIETDPFEDITTPQVWARAEKILFGDYGDEEGLITVVTIFPGGFAIIQEFGPTEGDLINAEMGLFLDANYNVTKNAYLRKRYVASLASDGNETPKNAPFQISLDTTMPPHFNYICGEDNLVKAKVNGMDISYLDLTSIPQEKWEAMFKEIKQIDKDDNMRILNSNPDSVISLYDLKTNFTRLK